MMQLTCFKAYDVRGKLGEELNEEVVYRIGRAFAQHLQAKRIVVGGDIRLTSKHLAKLRLNVEAKGNAELVHQRVAEIENLIKEVA